MKYILSTYKVSALRALGAVLLLSLTSLSVASAAMTYGSLTYHTIGYGASNEWSGVLAEPVVAANDNDGDYSYITTTHQGKAETFTFDTPTLPSGASLNGVSLYMFAKKVDVSDNGVTDPANDPQISFRVEDGANTSHVSDGGNVTISNDGTYALYSRHLTKNPITGNDWTLGDLASGGLRFGVVRTNEGSETGIEPRVTAFWIDINYSIDATTTGTSTEGTGGNGGNGGGSSTSTNTTPTANAQSITTTPNTAATTTLTGTDPDLPAQTLTFAIGTTTTNGTTTLVGNQITYTPNTNFVGTDSFTFTVSDGISTSTPATVTITVSTSTTSGGEGGSGGPGSGSSGGGSSSSSGGSGGGSNSVTSGGGYFVGGGSGSGAGSPAGKVLGASTSCGIYMTKFTRNGYRNDVDTVKKLQSFLNSYLGVSIPVTGYFGPLTEKYVKQLQLKHKDVMLAPWSVSTPTGISYLTTVTGINNIVCPDLHLIVPTNLIPFSAHPDTPKKIR